MHCVFLLLLKMNLIHNLKIFTALFYLLIRKNKAPQGGSKSNTELFSLI